MIVNQIELNAKEVYAVLKEKGINNLHHANTVLTSKTFIEEKALLSRNYIEKNELEQTPQKSDAIDKEFDIWDYIFLDAMNLSDYFSKPNEYGPVLFVLKLELLQDIETVRVTKRNPCYWKQRDSIESMYYTSIDEIRADYKTGNKLRDGGIMFIITSVAGKLDLSKYINEIQIDNPGLILTKNKEKINLCSIITNYLSEGIEDIALTKDQIKIRDLAWLKFNYNWMYRVNQDKYKLFFQRKEKDRKVNS